MNGTTINSEIAQQDLEAITAAVTDYAEGWYTGDAERMRRCLHPELMKRALFRDAGGREIFRPSTAEDMVAFTAARAMPSYLEAHGLSYRPDSLQILVDDIFADVASARCLSMHYLDLVQLARTAAGWKLVNVLWCHRGGEESERYRRWVEAAEREEAS